MRVQANKVGGMVPKYKFCALPILADGIWGYMSGWHNAEAMIPLVIIASLAVWVVELFLNEGRAGEPDETEMMTRTVAAIMRPGLQQTFLETSAIPAEPIDITFEKSREEASKVFDRAGVDDFFNPRQG